MGTKAPASSLVRSGVRMAANSVESAVIKTERATSAPAMKLQKGRKQRRKSLSSSSSSPLSSPPPPPRCRRQWVSLPAVLGTLLPAYVGCRSARAAGDEDDSAPGNTSTIHHVIIIVIVIVIVIVIIAPAYPAAMSLADGSAGASARYAAAISDPRHGMTLYCKTTPSPTASRRCRAVTWATIATPKETRT